MRNRELWLINEIQEERWKRGVKMSPKKTNKISVGRKALRHKKKKKSKRSQGRARNVELQCCTYKICHSATSMEWVVHLRLSKKITPEIAQERPQLT